MNGWQRFGILILCCFVVMVLFPNYNAAGWSFIGMLILMWTGAIMLIALISNIFALYRFAALNKFITFAVFCGIMYTLLWYFPQTDKVSPINKLKYGEYPNRETIDQGLKKMKFNFDFLRRNVRRDENFANQEELRKAKEKVNKMVKTVKEEPKNVIEILQEPDEE